MSRIDSSDFVISLPPSQAPPGPAPGPPGAAGTLWTTRHLQAPYGQYKISTRYTWNNGVLLEPVMQQTSGTLIPADIISYCSPYGTKEVLWTAKRNGFPPFKPDPNPIDPNLVLHSFVFSGLSNDLQEDGNTHIYEQSGYYVYLCLTPVPPSSGYSLGAPDFDQTPLASSITQSGEFVQGII